MEDVLNQPVSTVLQKADSADSSTLNFSEEVNSDAMGPCDHLRDMHSTWTASYTTAQAMYHSLQLHSLPLSTRKANMYSTKLMNLIPKYLSYIESATKCVSEGSYASAMEAFAADVHERSKILHESSAVPRAQKKKALSDLLKLLPDAGLSHRRSDVPHTERDEVSRFSEGSLYLQVRYKHSKQPTDSALRKAVEEGEKLFFELSIRKRVLAGKGRAPSEDLSPMEVERANNFCEHSQYMLRLQRRALRGSLKSLNALRHIVSCSDKAVSCARQKIPFFPERSKHALLNDLQNIEYAARFAIEQLQQMLELYLCYFDLEEDSSLRCILTTATQALSRAIEELEQYRKPLQDGCHSQLMLSSEDERVAQQCVEIFTSIRKRLDAYSEAHEAVPGWYACVDILAQAEAKCTSTSYEEERASGNEDDFACMDAMESLEEAIRSALLWVQRASRIAPSLCDAEKTEVRTMQEVMKTFEELMSQEVVDALVSTATDAIRCVYQASDDTKAFLASQLARFAPMLHLLHGAMQHYLSAFAVYYTKCARLANTMCTTFVKLFDEGFGEQKYQSKEQHHGQQQDDTAEVEEAEAGDPKGMGEGQGGRDVSEQIENEDQIMGDNTEDNIQDGTNNQPEEGSQGEEGQGIEMSSEFAEQQEDDITKDMQQDDSEQEENGNNEGMEKRFQEGKDENAEPVDECMWNQEEDQKQNNQLEDHQKPAGEAGQKSEKELRASEKDRDCQENGSGNAEQEQERRDQAKQESNEENAGLDDDAEAKQGVDDEATGIQPYDDREGDQMEEQDGQYDLGDMDLDEVEDGGEDTTMDSPAEDVEGTYQAEEEKNKEENVEKMADACAKYGTENEGAGQEDTQEEGQGEQSDKAADAKSTLSGRADKGSSFMRFCFWMGRWVS